MKRFFSGLIRPFWVLLLAAGLTGTLATSCTKEDTIADYSATDDALIQKYLTDNGITTAQKQTSGLYYVPITTNASAPQPTVGQVATILYTGRLLDGTIFDATAQHNNNPYSFVVGNNYLPAGIAEGISLMHKGDKALLLIPSRLGYGASGAGNTVPANTVLRFEVELTDLNPSFAVPDDKLLAKYLLDNNITNAQKQASGLYYVPVTTNPSGAQAIAGKTATVAYTGKRLDGSVFDSSTQGYPFVVGRGTVIKGWDEGIALMRQGEKGKLLIPSALAYGPTGSQIIAPNSVLIFDVEVKAVQ